MRTILDKACCDVVRGRWVVNFVKDFLRKIVNDTFVQQEVHSFSDRGCSLTTTLPAGYLSSVAVTPRPLPACSHIVPSRREMPSGVR